MRRVARHLFTLVSAVSLLLCVAVCLLWARSYWRSDEFDIVTHDYWHFDGSHHGKIAFVRQRIVPPGKLKPRVKFYSHDYAKLPNAPKGHRMWSPYASFCNPLYEKFGFIVGIRPWGVRGTKTSGFVVAVPHWSVVAVTAVLPMTWLGRARRARRRTRVGLCARCGYDLRATPDRCPECGAAARAAAEG